MNASFARLAGPLTSWLADYYLAATLVLLATFLAWRWMRQPVCRLAVAWMAMFQLVFLAFVCAAPFWPKISLVASNPREAEISAAATPTDVAPKNMKPEIRPERPRPVEKRAGDAETSPSHASAVPVPVATRPWDWRELFATGFFAGLLLMTAWLCWGAASAWRICHRARPAEASLSAELARITPAGIPRPRLLISSRVANAVALGVIRPTIVLPDDLAAKGPSPELRAVLRHECAHLRRRDLWLLAFGRCLLPILFAHPLLWWLRRAIRVDQEFLADAIAAGDDRHDYARTLVQLVRNSMRPSPAAVSAAIGIWEGPSQLSRRITMLVDDTFRLQTAGSRRWKLLAFGAMLLLGTACSLLTFTPARSAEEKKEKHNGATEEPSPNKTEKRDVVWLWTMGPKMVEGWANNQKVPVDAVCDADKLIEFYGNDHVMYFENGPHTPDVARRFSKADKLILSCDSAVDDKSEPLESLGPCPNLAGVIIDDFSNNLDKYPPDSLARIHRRLKARGDDLQLYTVVYTRDLGLDFKPYLPSIDVVSLWIWESKDLPDLDRHIERCREAFPNKPIVLGLYVYEYPKADFVPLDLVQFEFRKARDYSRRGLIAGYQVLGSYFTKELETPQARWVRDFLRPGGTAVEIQKDAVAESSPADETTRLLSALMGVCRMRLLPEDLVALNLSEKQRQSISIIFEKYHREMDEANKELMAGNDQAKPKKEKVVAYRKKMNELRKEVDKQVEEILTKEQKKYIEDLRLTMHAFWRSGGDLSSIGITDLTEDQKKAIRDLLAKCEADEAAAAKEIKMKMVCTFDAKMQDKLVQAMIGPEGPMTCSEQLVSRDKEGYALLVPQPYPFPDFSLPETQKELSLTEDQLKVVRKMLEGSDDLKDKLAKEMEKLPVKEQNRVDKSQMGTLSISGSWSESDGAAVGDDAFAKVKKMRSERLAAWEKKPTAKLLLEMQKQFEASLTPEQLAKYRRMAFDNLGWYQMDDPLVLHQIGATEAQKKSIAQEMRGFEDIASRLGLQVGKKVLEVLTPPQKEKLREAVEKSMQQPEAEITEIPPETDGMQGKIEMEQP